MAESKKDDAGPTKNPNATSASTRTRPVYRSLRPLEWPEADQLAWLVARRPGLRLVRGGRAAHLKPSTAKSMERAYGYLFEFLQRNNQLKSVLTTPAIAFVTPAHIGAFLEELKVRVGSVTRHIYLQRIYAIAKILSPEKDWNWLNEIVLDLKDQAQPRSKASRIVSSDRLLQLGLDLISRARTSDHKTKLQRARLHRNGLMIALLALCPIRLGNLAGLEIDKHLRQIDDCWWIILAPSETKTGRADERPLPQILTEAIDDWIEIWKPHFYQPSKRLWASTKGGGLAYTYVGGIITEVTLQELGVAVNPHLFRDCAVYTIAHNAGHEMGTASALLQHTDYRVTEMHYNRGASIEAVKVFQNVLDQLSDD